MYEYMVIILAERLGKIQCADFTKVPFDQQQDIKYHFVKVLYLEQNEIRIETGCTFKVKIKIHSTHNTLTDCDKETCETPFI